MSIRYLSKGSNASNLKKMVLPSGTTLKTTNYSAPFMMKSMPKFMFSVDFMKLQMPALSPTMAEGTIAKWVVQEGDKVDIGDVMCEVTTDKATVGYESQEEGFIAKILHGDGAVVPINGLIGIMVEEKEDIDNFDMSQVSDELEAPAAQKEEATPKAAEPKKAVASGSALGSGEFMDQLDHVIHSGEFLISPSAGWWLRTYMIMPNEVKSTGPKGFLLKGDVLKHIEDNKLEKGKRVGASPSKASAPKQEKKAPAPKGKASPPVDPNDPFQQTWEDASVSSEYAQVAEAIHNQKKYAAHSYMSSKCDVTAIDIQLKNAEGVSFESYVLKAASKSFAKVFKDVGATNVSRVVGGEKQGIQFYENANELQLSQLGSNDVHEGLYPFSANSPPAGLTVQQNLNSLESLPIVSANSLISLHFTSPASEVLTQGIAPGETFDIETLDDEDLTYELSMKVAKTSKVSISYDVLQVDDMTAAEFLKNLKVYLDDPDMMLL